MKIAFVTYVFPPSLGGIEVNSEILARNFAEAGHDVTVLTSTQGAPGSGPYVLLRRPTCLQVADTLRAAEIIFHNNPTLRYGVIGAGYLRKTVVAVRTWIARPDRSISLVDRVKRTFVANASARIFISQAVKDDCQMAGAVIGNPYRDELFRSTIDWSARTQEIAYVGRLAPEKGVHILLEAIAILARNSTNVKLNIFGEGSESSYLRALSHELGIGGRVNFLGAVYGADLAASLTNHKILVVPSTWEEPFGNVALEGLGAGCVPIVTRSGGLPDAIGECGLVVPKNDPNSLAEAIRDVLLNNFQGRSACARNQHLLNHTEKSVASKYLDVLEGVR